MKDHFEGSLAKADDGLILVGDSEEGLKFGPAAPEFKM
jgi:hypothetical protein